MKTKIGMLSLGCARNLVDAEVILGYLKKAGFDICEEIADSDVAIVNTCCFIREAEEESVDTILKLCQLKEEGRIKKIVVCGCLAQRYKNKLIRELKEVDAFVGVGSIDKIASVIKQVLDDRKNFGKFGQPKFLYSHLSPRIPLTPRHFAYVKICEGCNHRCSYCIIPSLRGRYRSRPMDSILKEADLLFNKEKVSEINLIGQDTTMYGKDLYGHSKLGPLLLKLLKLARGRWVRLLYAYPAHFSQRLIEVIKSEPSVCKYIDLPIQHINDKILKRMNRRTSQKQIFSLIDTLRRKIPHLAIRTTLIVGFPGETDKQFKELLDFIRKMKFERLGIFKYSRESRSRAYNFRQQVPEEVKQARYDEALSLQQDISREINEGFLGKEVGVLIDEVIDEMDEEHENLSSFAEELIPSASEDYPRKPKERKTLQRSRVFLGRTQYDAPEVDGCVYVKSKRVLKAGDFIKVKISDTLEYDLVGEAL